MLRWHRFERINVLLSSWSVCVNPLCMTLIVNYIEWQKTVLHYTYKKAVSGKINLHQIPLRIHLLAGEKETNGWSKTVLAEEKLQKKQ